MKPWLELTGFERIYENQHLLDATEIFRKLNVHKKVRSWRLQCHAETTCSIACISPSVAWNTVTNTAYHTGVLY